MAYPIKYIENNLVWNKDGECYAYYELVPYNYSFLSPEQKIQVHDSFRQLIAQNRDGKIHALQISTESSIRSAQERSKNEVTGKLKAVAYDKIDQQTDALISMIGENQVNYRFFIGFKLLLNDQEFSMKSLTVEAKNALSDFVYDVNHKLMGDFVSMSNDEILRFQKMEKLLENKISRRFKIRRLDKDDFGYLIEHLYGQTGTAYEEYEYHLSKKKLDNETLIKYYDLIKPTRCLVEEKQRYLKIQQEDETVYVAYFTINSIVGELDFPSSEIFYYQQQQFTFPIDTSMNVEIVANRKALSTVRNKKKELKDLDNHAWQSDNETSSNVAEALESVNELETNLDQSKESMYKLSYVVRVSANDLDELKRRCNEVKDFFLNIPVLTEKCQQEECISVFRSFKSYRSGELVRKEEKECMGNTLYIGSLQSEVYFCIYEKDYEQYKKNDIPIEDAEVKNRFEIRLKNERAYYAVRDLLVYDNPEHTAFKIINRYIRFVDKDDSKPRSDWKLNEEWAWFIGNNRERLKLTTKPEPYSFQRTLNWLSHQVAPTLKVAIKLDEINQTQVVKDILDHAKLTDRHKQILKQQSVKEQDVITTKK